jgi:Fic family protein
MPPSPRSASGVYTSWYSTARLVMHLLLLREDYPPTIILRVNRRQYGSVLARADAGHAAPLVNFVGRAVERSLTLYLEACTPRTAHRTPRPEAVAFLF